MNTDPNCTKCGRVLMVLSKEWALCPKNAEPDGEAHSRLVPLTPELRRAIQVAALPRAILFGDLQATSAHEPLDELPDGKKTCSARLYSMTGRAGLWRRVSRQVRQGELLVAATAAGETWQFVRWRTLEDQLADVGLMPAREDDDGDASSGESAESAENENA